MWSLKAASKSGVTLVPSASSARPICAYFCRSSRFRRKRSTARRLATVISQAPGLRGTPSCGHCSRAATTASWASSSASPTSPVYRASPAMSRAHSIRTTASIAAWVCKAVTTTDDTTRRRAWASRWPRAGLTGVVLDPRLQHHPATFCCSGRATAGTTPGPPRSPSVDRPDRALALADDAEEPLGPLDGFLAVAGLHQRPAADQFLGLGERPVEHGELAVLERHLDGLTDRSEPAGS